MILGADSQEVGLANFDEGEVVLRKIDVMELDQTELESAGNGLGEDEQREGGLREVEIDSRTWNP